MATPLTYIKRFPRASSRERLPLVLLLLLIVIWSVLAIEPVNRQDWLMENLLVLVTVPVLVATRDRMRFSNGSYVCMFIFFVLHSIGAHYTYSLVPYDAWWHTLTGSTLNQMLGWERNHYDRAIHFFYGVLLLQPSAELLGRYAPARGLWRSILPILFIMSHSLVFELVEWLARTRRRAGAGRCISRHARRSLGCAAGHGARDPRRHRDNGADPTHAHAKSARRGSIEPIFGQLRCGALVTSNFPLGWDARRLSAPGLVNSQEGP